MTGEKQNREPNLADAIRRRFQPFGGVDELQPHPPVTPPDWLQKAWSGAERRGLNALTPDDIDAEIDAHRRGKKPAAGSKGPAARERYDRMTQRDGRERSDGDTRPAADEVARKRRREVLRAEELSDADLAAIAKGEMDPRHHHLDDELEHAALEAWDSHEAKAARVVQARALKEPAGKGGLRFEAYLPPGLAERLLDLIERGVFADPSEAVFVIFGEHRDLEPHADLRRELLRRSCQAAMDDPRPFLSGDEVEKHFQELSAAPLPEPAVWRKTP